MRTHLSKRTKVGTSKVQGFSLTELMIAVAILGIISTFTVVAFNRNKNEEKLKLASKTILQYLNDAQIRSQQALKPCSIIVDHNSFELSTGNSNECESLPTVDLKNTIKGMSLSDLKICGTAKATNTSMPCNRTTNGSDKDDSGAPSTQSQLTFTPRGTVSEGGLLKLYSEKVNRTRCIAVLSPIGLIREGRGSDSNCDFNSF